MPSIRSTIRLALPLVAASSVVWSTADPAKSEQFSPPAGPLPQTTALDWPEEDLSGRMMDGAHRFVERQIADSQARSGRFWKYDRSSATAWNTSVQDNRDRLREIIGVVDGRVPPGLERFGDDENPALVAETSRYRVYQVRWPVLDGVSAEGLLVQPQRARRQPTSWPCPMPVRRRSRSSASHPDCRPNSQFARRLAESGCELIIPVLVRRELIQTSDEQLQRSQQTWREWLYRQAFHMGRHVIGYEVQKVLAAVDGFRARRGDDREGRRRRLCGGRPGGLLCGGHRSPHRRRARERLLRSARARLGGADRSQHLEPARAVRRCRDRLARAAAPSRRRARRRFRRSRAARARWQTPAGASVRGRVRPHPGSRRRSRHRRW